MPIAVTNTAHFNLSGVTHGQQINASNTGIAGAGYVVGDLSSTAGSTYSTPDEVVTLKRFTSPVTVTADGVTFRYCLFDFAGGSSTVALNVQGDNFTGEYLNLGTDGATSYYRSVYGNDCTGMTLERCDIHDAENCIEDNGTNTLLLECFLHDSQGVSNPPDPHNDVIEVYGGDNHTYRRCRIGDTTAGVTATINIAPWFGSTSVQGVLIEDSFIDGGNAHLLVDLQSTGEIYDVQILRNKMGGHTNVGVFGRYAALQNSDSRTIDETYQGPSATSIHWPTTGDDLSTWEECDDLTPDNTGVTVSP